MTQLAAEQRAWRLLLAAFATFVIICGATAYGIYWFLFQSTVDLDVTATASRGTVRVNTADSQEAVAVPDEPTDMDTGTTIKTDSTSEAVVTFRDPETEAPLAYLFIMKDSQVRLVQAQTRRFALNTAPDTISITSNQGKCYMVIVGDDLRTLNFLFTSPHGTVQTSTSGQYVIEVTSDWTKVTVQNGDLVMSSGQGDTPLHLSNSQHAYLAKGQQTQHPSVDKSLVANNQFTAAYSAGWKAYSEGDPAGTVTSGEFQGRPVVTIDRAQERWPNLILDHGVTGLVQAIGADVSNFTSLELQASFYVQEQSLSTCGIDGSECPLMLRVVYEDPSGVERTYIHGFYAFQDASKGYPPLCDTCRSDHERIRMQTWYTYSDNLIALLPAEQRPQFVKEISLYASGHAYIVHVAQMDLVGAKLRPPTAPGS